MKTRLLDIPVDPKSLFSPAVATMQKHCEGKRVEHCMQTFRAIATGTASIGHTANVTVSKPVMYAVAGFQGFTKTSSRVIEYV